MYVYVYMYMYIYTYAHTCTWSQHTAAYVVCVYIYKYIYIYIYMHLAATAVNSGRINRSVKNLKFAITDGLIAQRPFACAPLKPLHHLYKAAYVSIQQHTAAYVSIRQALRVCPTETPAPPDTYYIHIIY